VPQKKTTRVCWYWGVARRVDARAGLVAGRYKKGTGTIFGPTGVGGLITPERSGHLLRFHMGNNV